MLERDSNPRVTTLPELKRRFRPLSHSDLGVGPTLKLCTISPQHCHVMPDRPVAVVAAWPPRQCALGWRTAETLELVGDGDRGVGVGGG